MARLSRVLEGEVGVAAASVATNVVSGMENFILVVLVKDRYKSRLIMNNGETGMKWVTGAARQASVYIDN